MSSSDTDMTIVTAEAVSGRRGPGEPARRIVESRISVELLEANLGGFLAAVRDLIAGQATRAGAFELDEIGLSAEIGADGQLKLLGAGMSVHGSSGLQLTWRRGEKPLPGS